MATSSGSAFWLDNTPITWSTYSRLGSDRSLLRADIQLLMQLYWYKYGRLFNMYYMKTSNPNLMLKFQSYYIEPSMKNMEKTVKLVKRLEEWVKNTYPFNKIIEIEAMIKSMESKKGKAALQKYRPPGAKPRYPGALLDR